MNILDKLETSYNRQIQAKILIHLDAIDETENRYLEEKHKFKIIYLENVHQLVADCNREKALLHGYHKDYKDELKKLKTDYKNNIAELKENKGFNIKEAKQSVSLIMSKIDSNYKRARNEFVLAIKNGHSEYVEKLKEFEQKFNEYRQIEFAKRQKEKEKNVDNLNQTYIEDVKKLKTAYFEKRNSIKVIHHNTTRQNYKKEIKNRIKAIELQIDSFKKEMKSNENSNRSNLQNIFKEYKNIKKAAKREINIINQAARVAVSKMDSEQRHEYHALQKYINEDYQVRRLRKLDAKEKALMKNVNPAYIYVAPAFLGELFFTLFPFIFMIIGSFFRIDFANLSKTRWYGIQNFLNIFTKDVEFQKALVNTAIYAFITIVLLTVVTISMAAWLSKNTKIHNIAQTMVFTPHIASLVSISILWIAMLNPSGIINQALALFGVKGPAWLLQENTSLFSVSLVTVWKDIGYYVLIIIAGLQGIPTYVYEAAKLDKAKKSTTFFKITLPLLAPTMSFVFLTKFINSFKVFAPIEIMTNGGPMGSSMVLSYWIYKVGRIGFNYGQAMAGAIVLTLMIAATTALKNVYFNKTIKY